MPSLPIPVFAACVLAFLALRAWRRGGTSWPFLVLILACAVQALVVAGHHHYGLWLAQMAQPVLALCLPPLAWLAFVAGVRRPLGAQDMWHLVAPGVGLFARVAAPMALDALIVAVFLAYGGAILWALRGRGDLDHARLAAGEGPLRLWRWVGGVLILSALSDVVIPVLAAAGLRDWVMWLVTGFSTASLVALGVLGLAPDLEGAAEPEVPQPATEGDAALVAALERMLEERWLALDPDLTLARIARRMGVPAKALSAAVNRVRGENISRVVNRWRIDHAAGMLRGGASVTEAMLGSGFNTKSNFNREFLRVMGQAPTAWMAAQKVGQ